MTAEVPEKFREAMSAFPSGVTIMTTIDGEGERRGFAASSFCSLSLDPPLVLVCLGKTAQCHDAFMESDTWAIQVAAAGHVDLISRFATKGSDKFAGGEFEADARGVPILNDAAVVLGCTAHERYDGGDHTILIARVESVTLRDHAPAIYFQREFRELELNADDLEETA
ncbi:MAG: putative NADH-dependent flavin oxidoreductase [Aeromicrobium sp.]|jgi:flavin reductase ActVB|uniref:flavin reductase family protein n=1 Tax=Aeromicrobium sp. TaxID=1871063 RepID=UPI0026252BA4|nr:flavin reductase family protein [Aeromicrobium sp.]MCW2789613.1 putative NADH-dependent flavin oxidoreductase [Aeromicrobium sp.]MCW2824996.1 putative NADH-dependent flavin oxidoreductase [Aeromicrobium sp.]